MRALFLALALILFPAIVHAHGGGLNRCGCHFNRKTGECHCHRPWRGCGCACQDEDRCKPKPKPEQKPKKSEPDPKAEKGVIYQPPARRFCQR